MEYEWIQLWYDFWNTDVNIRKQWGQTLYWNGNKSGYDHDPADGCEIHQLVGTGNYETLRIQRFYWDGDHLPTGAGYLPSTEELRVSN